MKIFRWQVAFFMENSRLQWKIEFSHENLQVSIKILTISDKTDKILTIQREELLKQQCHTGKVVSNIHRLGPRNTQKMQINWKTIGRRLRRRPTGGGASRRPLWVWFFNSLATFCVFFGPSLCMLLATFPVWHCCFNNSALCRGAITKNKKSSIWLAQSISYCRGRGCTIFQWKLQFAMENCKFSMTNSICQWKFKFCN